MEAANWSSILVGAAERKTKVNDATLSPSSNTYPVAEETSELIVAIIWLQSPVRDSAKREILYNLAIHDSTVYYLAGSS